MAKNINLLHKTVFCIVLANIIFAAEVILSMINPYSQALIHIILIEEDKSIRIYFF